MQQLQFKYNVAMFATELTAVRSVNCKRVPYEADNEGEISFNTYTNWIRYFLLLELFRFEDKASVKTEHRLMTPSLELSVFYLLS